MPAIKLNQRRVDVLKPRKSAYDVRDRDLKGFGLRVWPSGKKRYFVHSQHGGRRVWKTIASAESTSAGEARARAATMLAAIRRGGDAPASPEEAVFEAVADEVFTRYARNWKPGTLKVNRNYYRNHILPRFKGRPIAGIDSRDVRQWFAWNHSYLDTTPPYYGALAIMAAVYYRNRTGKGQYIDQAQYQPGLMLTGTTILDNSSNGRRATRTGNRSQGLPGAPHGIYRCAGVDEWIAIAVVTDEEWRSLCAVMGNPSWSQAPELATMEGRLRLQDDLDRNMEEWTKTQQKYDLMYQLQASRVRAGAVQSPEDKFERDPQLKEQDFFVHLDHSEIGVMPFTRHITAKLSRTPAHPGGPVHRGAPCVGEDNASVYEELLGLSPVEVQSYAEERVI